MLKDKGLLPELSPQVENIVCSLDRDLQGAAAAVATILREKGQSVDLVMETKPLKWYTISYVPFCILFCRKKKKISILCKGQQDDSGYGTKLETKPTR